MAKMKEEKKHNRMLKQALAALHDSEVQVKRAFAHPGMSDDVKYLAADTFCDCYRLVNRIDSSKLKKLSPSGTIEKIANYSNSKDDLLSDFANAFFESLKSDRGSKNCEKDFLIETDEDIRKKKNRSLVEYGLEHLKEAHDEDGEKDEEVERKERLVVRNEDHEIIFQAIVAAAMSSIVGMTIYLDLWVGKGGKDIPKDILREEACSKFRQEIGAEGDKMVKIKTRFVDKPLVDIELDTFFYDEDEG